ncbi:MAG: radical SAM protein [Deltaproteobacteria bacterium]|nr:MAG: radical SAM protein [Deltaproteobacteria bacterium]
MLKPLLRAPLYNLARRTGRLRPLPTNLTFSVSYRCNSTCRTCNVWRKRVADFTLDEYERTFRSLGHAPYWLTFSGGEPFLRRDLVDIILAAYRECRPGIINIPTNAILTSRVVEGMERLAREAPDAQIVINLSLDGIGARHDELRGVRGNYTKLCATYAGLRELRAPNLTIGIHTVVSRLNIAEFEALHEHVRRELKPDSFITELAEERVELDTIGLDITPEADAYQRVVDRLVADADAEPAEGVAGIAQAFRRHYYDVARRTLAEQRQVLPCYAGIASAHVAPNGDVWTCCIRAEPMGNLRDTGYDFRRVWETTRADELRASIKRGECHCPLANAAYSSMLCDPPSLLRVARNFLKAKTRARHARAS